MAWIVCGVFAGGLFVGVTLMALMTAAREPAARPPLSVEAAAGSSLAVCRGVWHLTPRGWEPAGIMAARTGQHFERLPADRVLTCCYREHDPFFSYGLAEKKSEFWRCGEPALVRKLMEKFGELPPGLMDQQESYKEGQAAC